MKPVFFTILLLVALNSVAQNPTTITQTITTGQQYQHASSQTVATNQIATLTTGAYTATQSVRLHPGFLVQTGAVFAAIVRAEPSVSDESTSRYTMRAFPNPFGSTTRIEYVLPYSCPVRGQLLDINGQIIRTQENSAWQEAGRHELRVSGADLPVGTYIYQLQTGSQQQSIRLVRQP